MAGVYFMFAVATASLAWAAALPQTHTNEVQIIGGTAAALGEFPFIVSMQRSTGAHVCGGSLINANTVVTAAHCVVNMNASSDVLQVRAGSLTHASGGTLVPVSKWIMDPRYNPIDYDVAILKLSSPIPISSTISYVSLPLNGSEPVAGELTEVAGWGSTRLGGTISDTLNKVSLPIWSRADCVASYGDQVTDRMFCAGEVEGGKDSCSGDSGGPLLDSNNTLIGLVSWGRGCALAGYPGVNARVSMLLDFILENA